MVSFMIIPLSLYQHKSNTQCFSFFRLFEEIFTQYRLSASCPVLTDSYTLGLPQHLGWCSWQCNCGCTGSLILGTQPIGWSLELWAAMFIYPKFPVITSFAPSNKNQLGSHMAIQTSTVFYLKHGLTYDLPSFPPCPPPFAILAAERS